MAGLLGTPSRVGLASGSARSRRPRTSQHGTPSAVRDRVVALRTDLVGWGLDAGPVTIAWHLGVEAAPGTVAAPRGR